MFSNEPVASSVKVLYACFTLSSAFPSIQQEFVRQGLGSQPLGWLVSWENGKSVRCLSIGRFMTKETGLRVYNAIKETEGKSPWVKSD